MNHWISLVVNSSSFNTITPFAFHKRRALSEIRLNGLTRGSLLGPTSIWNKLLQRSSVIYEKRGSKV